MFIFFDRKLCRLPYLSVFATINANFIEIKAIHFNLVSSVQIFINFSFNERQYLEIRGQRATFDFLFGAPF